MHADLTAGSRHEHLALYDPAAIPPDAPFDPNPDAQDPVLPPAAAIAALTAAGDVLVLHLAEEDCEARLRVFVGEEPPAAVRERGRAVLSGAALRVPSGVLKADGLEFVVPAGGRRTHALPSEARVPPGRYRVEVLDLLPWKLGAGAARARRHTTGGQRLAHRLTMIYLWLGVVLIPANLFGAWLVVAWFWRFHGWQSGVTALGVILAIDAVVFGGFHLLQRAQKRAPGLTAVADADAAFEREYPDVAVVLRAEAAGDPTPAPPSLARLTTND